MPYEFLFRPVHLVSNLWQERATAIAFLNVNAMSMQLKFIQTLNTTHGGKDRDFDVYIVQLITAQRLKPRILEGSCTRHFRYNLIQRYILAKMPYTTTQTPLFVERDKRTTFFFE